MLSFLVNTVAIIVGSAIGIVFRNKIKKEICDQVMKVIGLTLLVISMCNALIYMASVKGTQIELNGTLVLILCIVIGTFIGEFLKIDDGFNKFGLFIEKKINKGKICEGFITSSLLFCIGSMAIIGTFDAVSGNPDTIYLKSILDGVTSIALAATLGFGVALSSISVFVYQGILTIIFLVLKDVFPNDLIVMINMVGYVLIAGLALNFLIENKVKVANMLPSLLVVIIYYLISGLF